MSSVGQAVGGFVGGVVGFFVGGPTGALYGAQIGMGVGGLIDPPKGPNLQGPRLSDLSVQTSTYGAPIPRIYGTVATHGNVFWLENNRLKEVARKQKQGGKGGPKSTVTTYSYFATFAVGLCQGPIEGVRRIWVGSKLIYDAGSDNLESIIASNRAAQGFRVYLGTEAQQPDTRMQAALGVANCPAYRGLAYIVFYDFALADYGNSLMAAQVKVEIAAKITGNAALLFDESFGTVSGASTLASRRLAGRQADQDGFSHYVVESATREPIWVREISGKLILSAISTTLLGLETPMFPGPTGQGAVAQISNSLHTLDYVFRSWRQNGDDGRYISYGRRGGLKTYDTGSNGITARSFSEYNGRCYVVEVAFNENRLTAFNENVNNFVSSDFGARIALAFKTSTATTHIVIATPHGCVTLWSGSASEIEVSVYSESLSLIDSYTLPFPGLVTINAQDSAGVWSAGKIYFASRLSNNPNLFVLNTESGQLAQYHVAVASRVSPSFPAINVIGDVVFVSSGQSNPTFFAKMAANLNTFAIQAVPLSVIAGKEVVESKIIETDDIDVSALTQNVRGYRVAQTAAIRASLDPLQAAWPFDVVQRGYKLHFVPRGQSPVATIDASELDARPYSDAPGDQLIVTHEMDTQLPRKVSLRHLDINREYDLNEQPAERQSTDSVHVRDAELPIVLTAAEAAGMAEVLLYLYWLERRDVTFRLPPTRRGLQPADVVTITGQWGQYQLRLTEVHLLSDGRLECRAKYNAAAIYTPTAVGAEGQAPQQQIGLDGPSLYRLIDGPCLRDADNAPGMYAAMSGYTNGWPGGILFRSTDGGQTWVDVQGWTDPVTIGFARGTIGAGRTDILDTASQLQVDVLSGQLESVDDLTLFAGANHFAYGAHGRWEIIAARTCLLQADGSYILRDFLRGRRGTEWAMTTHQAGDALVLLSDIDTAFIGVEASSIGQSRLYRGITAGRAIDSDDDLALTYAGVNLRPLSPVYLNGHRASNNDWTITWQRRGRIDAEWRDLVDVPVGEATESYEIEVCNAAFTTVLRTLTATSQTVQYTSAQQVTDHGSNQSTIHLRIYQMSAAVGRGYPLQQSITR